MSRVSAILQRHQWLILVVAVLVGIVALGLVYYREIGVSLFARGLYTPDNEAAWRAGQRLASCGLPGRRAMLRAVCEGPQAAADRAMYNLAHVLREDLQDGRTIEPIVDEALAGIDMPGEVGVRLARIASEGWAAGLLDDEAKRRLVARCVRVKVVARPEYPLQDLPERGLNTENPEDGAVLYSGCPWAHFHEEGLSDVLDFGCARYTRSDRQSPETSWRSTGTGLAGAGSEYFYPISDPTFFVGQRTASASVKVGLIGYHKDRLDPCGNTSQPTRHPGGGFKPVDDAGWSMEIEATPVKFNVVAKVPDDYLKAKTTPELDAAVRRAVVLTRSPRGGTHGHGYSTHTAEFAKGDLPVVCIREPLSVDLAFRARWHVVKTGKTGAAYCPLLPTGGSRKGGLGIVIPKGHTDECRLHPSRDLLADFTAPGQYDLAIRITLESSLASALNYPEVEAYWPGTIELPETTFRFTVKKPDIEVDRDKGATMKEEKR